MPASKFILSLSKNQEKFASGMLLMGQLMTAGSPSNIVKIFFSLESLIKSVARGKERKEMGFYCLRKHFFAFIKLKVN